MLNKLLRMGALWFGTGRKAQTAAIPGGIARICNAADFPKPGFARRKGLVQHGLKLFELQVIWLIRS
jgi:hypothetical protein